MDDYMMVQELRGWADSDSPDEDYPDVDRDIDLYVQALLRQHDVLSKRDAELCALEAAGVDNWSGYDEAQDVFREMEWEGESNAGSN